jgi:hypothetical protein
LHRLRHSADGKRTSTNLKESIMDKDYEQTQDVEVIDLGDAKEVTQGPKGPNPEDHPVLRFQD